MSNELVQVNSMIPMTGVNAQLNTNDVLSIVVSDREEQNIAAELALDAQLRQRAEGSKAAKEQMDKAALAVAKTALTKRTEALIVSLKAFKEYGKAKYEITGRISEGKVDASARITGKPGSYHSFEVSEQVTFTPEIKQLLAKIDRLAKESENLMKEKLEVRESQKNLPRFERKARAHLAKHQLSQTPEGREMLAVVQQSVKQLPGIIDLG